MVSCHFPKSRPLESEKKIGSSDAFFSEIILKAKKVRQFLLTFFVCTLYMYSGNASPAHDGRDYL